MATRRYGHGREGGKGKGWQETQGAAVAAPKRAILSCSLRAKGQQSRRKGRGKGRKSKGRNGKDDASQTQQHVKILKLKKGRVSEPLL